MSATRRHAFAAIREVCGPEICPKISNAERSGAELGDVAATAHHMRHALAAFLILATGDPDRCPNCRALLPGHADPCHIRRLLVLAEGPAEAA